MAAGRKRELERSSPVKSLLGTEPQLRSLFEKPAVLAHRIAVGHSGDIVADRPRPARFACRGKRKRGPFRRQAIWLFEKTRKEAAHDDPCALAHMRQALVPVNMRTQEISDRVFGADRGARESDDRHAQRAQIV